MFLLKEKVGAQYSSGYVAKIWMRNQGVERHICNIHSWGFNSCAVHNLAGFNSYLPKELLDVFDAEEFFKFAGSCFAPDWQAQEVYFLVSDHQLKDYAIVKKLVKHPKVKRRDRFANKAHGPNDVHLFRYSASQDFPVRLKYGT